MERKEDWKERKIGKKGRLERKEGDEEKEVWNEYRLEKARIGIADKR